MQLASSRVMHILIAALLAIHGMIHVLGFLKAFGFAELSQLTALTSRPVTPATIKVLGVLWLCAASLLVASAVGVLARSSWWWTLAALGIGLSQIMIVTAWDAAKAGTLLNMALAVPVVLAAADARFSSTTQTIVRGLLPETAGAPARDVVLEEELHKLPAPVSRWLAAAGVVGKPRAVTVRLTQKGALRTSPEGKWLPATAEQVFRVDEPAFVWRVRTRMYALPVAGRDVYLGGRGRMTIKLGALIPVVDARDERIDQGTLQRFLGEIIWFPSAALREYIRWEPIDEHSAKATMTYGGVSGSAVFSFNAEGRVARVSARRYLGSEATARLEDWIIPMREYRTFEGVRVPSAGDVIWKLRDGDFNYFAWQVTRLETNLGARDVDSAYRELRADVSAY